MVPTEEVSSHPFICGRKQPVSEKLPSLEYRTMDRIIERSNPEIRIYTSIC
jgi:hypothetical protein